MVMNIRSPFFAFCCSLAVLSLNIGCDIRSPTLRSNTTEEEDFIASLKQEFSDLGLACRVQIAKDFAVMRGKSIDGKIWLSVSCDSSRNDFCHQDSIALANISNKLKEGLLKVMSDKEKYAIAAIGLYGIAYPAENMSGPYCGRVFTYDVKSGGLREVEYQH